MNEAVDRVGRRPLCLGGRHRGAHHGRERPVVRPFRALVDPFLDGGNLFLGQAFAGIHRRHPFIGIIRAETPDHLAGVPFPRHDSPNPGFQFRHRPIPPIEAEARLALRRIRTVAFEAVVRQHRKHLAGKIDLILSGRQLAPPEEAGPCHQGGNL